MKCLHGHVLLGDILIERVIGYRWSLNSSVYAKIKLRFPNLIGLHCFNHSLELSVHDNGCDDWAQDIKVEKQYITKSREHCLSRYEKIGLRISARIIVG